MKKLLLSLLALPLLLFSCEKPSKEPAQEDIITLEVTSEKQLSFKAEGGEGVINYTLTNATDLTPLKVEAQHTWVSITEVAESIKFNVCPNDELAERSTTITISYNTLTQSVTIKQDAASYCWAIVGSMTNDWDASCAIEMESIEGYYVARGMELSTTDSFKFILNGVMQGALGGNGKVSECDFKYDAQKYGSDIRINKSGVYDIYLDETLDSYYIMSEGKDPKYAEEALKPGEDVWYVNILGENIKMRNSGIFVVATDVTLPNEGFRLRNSLTGEYGAAGEDIAEVGDEITIVGGSEYNIKVNFVAENKYDIYLKANEYKVWVLPKGEEPIITHIGTSAEGSWFDSKNFVVCIYAEGLRVTIDCDTKDSVTDAIIPEATFSVDGIDGYIINNQGCEVANNIGKAGIVSGYVSFKHTDNGYDIYLDVLSDRQQIVKLKYTGKITPFSLGGTNSIVNPGEDME